MEDKKTVSNLNEELYNKLSIQELEERLELAKWDCGPMPTEPEIPDECDEMEEIE